MNKQKIKKLLQKDNPVVLEVGSAGGGDSLEFLKEFSQVQLYCFEPDPRAIALHKSRVQDSRCQLYEIAMSDTNGQAEFYQSSGQHPKYTSIHDWSASSSLKAPKEHLKLYPWCTFDTNIKVPTCRLDTWAEEHQIGEVDFIWADVQGAEEELIKGGLKTLSRTRYFYTEYYNKEIYQGQPNIERIKFLIPAFKDIEYYKGNVLFKNLELVDR
ncbi:FkbM family methyltransferase [Gloeocapsopsis crepidinum LEGE 06123]|uniref:FkbM family methyltransferase n=1 Tax=Gloeocapsopsis crepidinum LEGE 06123 TaxID=588587 RepID=A0ABR9UWS8_9CHRO|nr:FkbM family methyltransferase [Gloeocapsopsis crepidinum]MBE9192463.1 FkbM family methyltransferase [Gloeocapsopsis crepidinum LEGE 06123]